MRKVTQRLRLGFELFTVDFISTLYSIEKRSK